MEDAEVMGESSSNVDGSSLTPAVSISWELLQWTQTDSVSIHIDGGDKVFSSLKFRSSCLPYIWSSKSSIFK